MIIITATISTQFAASRDEVLALCTEHCIRSRAEPGCIAHHIHVDCEEPERLFFYEEWQDEDAVAAHFAIPESRSFVKRLTTLLGEQPEIKMSRTEVLSPTDLV
ncbi:MAG: putative quinol monooxygenase [Sphingorhabdus sp.]